MERLHWVLRTPDSAHAALIVGAVAIALGGAALFAIVAHTITPLSTQRVMGFVPRDSLARVELVIPAKPGEIKGKGLTPIRVEAPAPTLPVGVAPPDPVPASLSNAQWEGPPPKPVVLTRTSDENPAHPEPVDIKPVERTRIAELAILEAKWTRPALLPAVHIETRTEEPKPANVTAFEPKHAAPKAVASRVAEAKRIEPKPTPKLAEAKRAEPKVALKVTEAKRAEAKAAPAKVVEARRVEAKPAKPKIAEAKHYEPKPAFRAAVAKAIEPKRFKTRSASLKMSEAKHVAPRAAPTRLAEAKPVDKRAEAKRAAELKAAEAQLAEVRHEAEIRAKDAKLADAKRAADMQAAEARLAEARHAAEMQAAEAKLADAQHAAEMRAAEAKLAETRREVETTLAEAKRAKAKLQETKQAMEMANPVRPATYTTCETCGTVTSVTTRMLDRGSRDIEVRVHFGSGNNIVFVYPNDPGFWSGDHVRLQAGRLMRM